MVDTPIKINPQQIRGNWRAGWTLDEHTQSSSRLPDGSFDTIRTELGELLYQLKYRHDRTRIRPIADIVSPFIKNLFVYRYLTVIIPIPPSDTTRPFQPVFEIATEVGEILNLPVSLDYLVKIKSTKALKEIEDPETRRNLLQGSMQVSDQRFAGKYVLLLDDLYRSGETLKAATDILMNQGKISRVFVLALTRTRTKK